jgi:FAD/FMN-containing dehydrogenase
MNVNTLAGSSFPLKNSYTNFSNWSGEIKGSHIMTCTPASESELLLAVNWAYQNKYKARPLGMQHNWSPLTIANSNDNSHVLLIDMKKNFANISITASADGGIVTAQTGVTMEKLLTELEKKKLGFIAFPAPGDITLGGVLAIGGHGTALPAAGETLSRGTTFGSLSNSIISLTAVVWDETQQAYILKKFMRYEADIAAFLVHVGRAFISEVTLQVPRNKRLRCHSFSNVAIDELFGKPDTGKRDFASFVEKTGRVEAIWFPFTDKPWVKTWTVTPSYPSKSRPVHSPYNYPFSDNVPKVLSDIIKNIQNNQPQLTPTLGKTEANLVDIGLGATNSGDLWGWSKDLLLYVKPTTLRVTANGYAIITRRANIQRVIHEFFTHYQNMVAKYQAVNSWPMNGPVEIRVTGLDQPTEWLPPGSVAPALSATRPDDNHPEWDTAIWLDILTMPDTPDANKFYHEMENWIFKNYTGDYAMARVEWSKGWGYTNDGTWSNKNVLNTLIPQSLGGKDKWDAAIKILNRYDPNNIFSSPMLKKLMIE